MSFSKFLQFLQFWWMYVIALLTFIITVTSRILFHGEMFGFDYFVYQPDGALYTHMALTLGGVSSDEATKAVIDWYATSAKPGLILTEEFFNPSINSDAWNLVGARLIYPLFSTPFVALFGIHGMLIVPIMSFAVLIWLILRSSVRLQNPILGLVLVFIVTVSPTVTRWYVANLTDGILASVIALSAYIIIFELRYATLTVLLLVTVGSFTRFSLPFWIALGLFLLKEKKVRFSILLISWSIISFVPAILFKPNLSFIAPQESQSVIERLFEFIWEALRLIFVEFSQLAALDRPLLSILIAGVILSLFSLQLNFSVLFLYMGLAGWFIGALNPVLGVNFRYQLPILFPACLVIIARGKFPDNRLFGNTLNIIRKKADK
jgi:hypothetical protein